MHSILCAGLIAAVSVVFVSGLGAIVSFFNTLWYFLFYVETVSQNSGLFQAFFHKIPVKIIKKNHKIPTIFDFIFTKFYILFFY